MEEDAPARHSDPLQEASMTASALVGWLLLAFFVGNLSALWFIPSIMRQVYVMARDRAKKWEKIAKTWEDTARNWKTETKRVAESASRCNQQADQAIKLIEQVIDMKDAEEGRVIFARTLYPDLIEKWKALTEEERATWFAKAKAARQEREAAI